MLLWCFLILTLNNTICDSDSLHIKHFTLYICVVEVCAGECELTQQAWVISLWLTFPFFNNLTVIVFYSCRCRLLNCRALMERCLRWMLKSPSSLWLSKPCLKVRWAEMLCCREHVVNMIYEVCCNVCCNLCSDLGMDDEGDDDPVPLPNVNAAILKKVKLLHWYHA